MQSQQKEGDWWGVSKRRETGAESAKGGRSATNCGTDRGGAHTKQRGEEKVAANRISSREQFEARLANVGQASRQGQLPLPSRG